MLKLERCSFARMTMRRCALGQRRSLGPAFTHQARYGNKLVDADCFGASLRVDADFLQCVERARQAFQALAEHLAALAECGGGEAFELLEFDALRCCFGSDVDDSGHDLGRRCEGAAVDLHGDARVAAPLG